MRQARRSVTAMLAMVACLMVTPGIGQEPPPIDIDEDTMPIEPPGVIVTPPGGPAAPLAGSWDINTPVMGSTPAANSPWSAAGNAKVPLPAPAPPPTATLVISRYDTQPDPLTGVLTTGWWAIPIATVVGIPNPSAPSRGMWSSLHPSMSPTPTPTSDFLILHNGGVGAARVVYDSHTLKFL